jgi:hypothetical protein
MVPLCFELLIYFFSLEHFLFEVLSDFLNLSSWVSLGLLETWKTHQESLLPFVMGWFKFQFGFVILGQISKVLSFRVQFFGTALNSPCGTMVEISSQSTENRPSSTTTHMKWHYWVIALKSDIIMLWEVLDFTCFGYLVSIFDLVLFSDSHILWELLQTFNH